MKMVFKSGWTLRLMLTNQGEGHTASGKAIQGCVQDSLQLWLETDFYYCPFLQASRCSFILVVACRTRMKGTSPHQMGGDFE